MKMRLPDSMMLYMASERHGAEGCAVSFEDVKAWVKENNETLCIYLTAKDTPVKYVRLRWTFSDAECRKDAVRITGDQWERGYGEMEWRGIVPHRSMPWVCAVTNGSDADANAIGRFTECFGVKVRPSAMCFWQYDPKGVTLWADVRNGGEGVQLGGRELKVGEVIFGEYRDMTAFHAMNSFYGLLCDDPLLPDHKVYGSNNWYYAYGNSSHEEILSDTDLVAAMCEGLENRPYMVIDDGWQPNRVDGPWNRGNERFPDMKLLAERMKEKGVRPGIWVRYLSDVKRQTEGVLPEHRMTRDDNYLDPSHPAVLERVAQDTKRIVDWGYQLIKHDFSTFDIVGWWGFQRPDIFAADGWHFYDRTKTTAEIIVNFYRTILEAAEGKALILGCNVIGHLAAGLVHLNRTGDDTSGREWDRTRRYGVNTLAFRMLHNNNFYAADADCVGITGAVEWKLNREWMNSLAASGSPLFVSCKPGICSEQELAELCRAFARNSVQEDVLEPIDWMESTCPTRWRLNGEEVRFDWYAEEGVVNTAPL